MEVCSIASFSNLESNVTFELNLLRNSAFDYDINRNKDENWIPFTLRVKTPDQMYEIKEEIDAALTESELEYLENGIRKQLVQLRVKEPTKFHFCNCEFNFEIIFCNVPEDNLIEVGLWINVGA